VVCAPKKMKPGSSTFSGLGLSRLTHQSSRSDSFGTPSPFCPSSSTVAAIRRKHHVQQQKRSTTESEATFKGPYEFTPPHMKSPLTLRINDTIQLIDKSLVSIDHFEQRIEQRPNFMGNHARDDSINITVHIVGTKYSRFKTCQDLNGFLRSDSHEVYKDGRDKYDVTTILQKVTLVKTNASYPLFATRLPETFVCRYSRKGNAILRLRPDQADPGRTRLDPIRQRNMFIHHRSRPQNPKRQGRYTFGDAFCGVGGSSAGARQAGLEVKWGFDSDKGVCQCYSENFPRARVLNARVDQALALNELGTVDVLHVSPPCQTWSFAHTVDGPEDDYNSAALFCVKDLLTAVRPRIVTMEQVCGLVRKTENK
jgi:C-5 cytosine-specific DNA methylase